MKTRRFVIFALFLGLMNTSILTKVRAADFDKKILEHCRAQIAESKALLNEILSIKKNRDVANTLVPYNKLGKLLDSAGALAGLMSSVHPEKRVRTSAETCESEISKFATELSLNRELYEAFTGLNTAGLDATAQRLVSKTIQDYKRSGVDKDEATRARIRELNEELVVIGQEFDRNVREDMRYIELDSKDELKGLPDDYVQAHQPGANGKIRITTDYPDYVPFMSYAHSGEARRRLAEVFKNRGYPKNESVLKHMLEKRAELAKALGYSSWAAYVTEDKMIREAEAVSKFIEEVSAIAKTRAQRELDELVLEKKKDDPQARQIQDWEKAYYEERVKLAKYSFDAKAVRPYFEFTKAKQGLLDLTSELFAIEYRKVSDAKVWHDSVEVYDVYEENQGKHLGRIYLDLHPRDGKYKHAAQFTLRSGVAGEQIPEGVLVCNFPDPKSAQPYALMEHGDVVTLFHEFGHLLHHVLGGHQKWIRFSGVATEWDFVEAPSQFLEEWAWDANVLGRFATHVETGEAISPHLVEKMRIADEFGQGVAARQQMFYAALSLGYHNQDPSKFDPLKMLKDLQSKYSMFPYQPGTYFHLNFGHLNGYSAMYYTYMWSQVIAKDLLSVFKQKGMMNLDLALQYRKKVLEPGGSKDAADLVKDFLGRPYSFDAFREWLNGSES
ncbi:MAG: M3 family metallopeptidase [Bdellovibrionota bacterium]